MDATGYLKHNATVQVTSGAVDCLFARELIRQFVVQNPAEVTDKANGERTVMSARCYWKPGDGADRATPRVRVPGWWQHRHYREADQLVYDSHPAGHTPEGNTPARHGY